MSTRTPLPTVNERDTENVSGPRCRCGAAGGSRGPALWSGVGDPRGGRGGPRASEPRFKLVPSSVQVKGNPCGRGVVDWPFCRLLLNGLELSLMTVAETRCPRRDLCGPLSCSTTLLGRVVPGERRPGQSGGEELAQRFERQMCSQGLLALAAQLKHSPPGACLPTS